MPTFGSSQSTNAYITFLKAFDQISVRNCSAFVFILEEMSDHILIHTTA